MTRDFFNSVVHEWYHPLFRFAISLCHDQDEALDLTQATFYKFSSKGHSIKDMNKVKSWLFSVMHREFVDQYRKKLRRPTTGLENLGELASEEECPASEKADASLLLEILAGMDEKYRAPITLFYLQNLSYKEIAAALGVPIGTVMSRLCRGKEQLRTLFESGLPEKSQPIPFPKEGTHE